MGFVFLGRTTDDDEGNASGQIPLLYLVPTAWRLGIGRALIQRALQEAQDRGLEEISLWVFEGNDRARRFYEAVGFSLDWRGKMDSTLSGVPLPEVRYSLRLPRMDSVP